MSLSKQTFARGLQLINAVLGKNSQIETTSTLDSYYLLLKDLPDQCFLEGVVQLMKYWENPHFKPGPGEIRKAVENIMYAGLSKEEFLLVAKAYKETGKEYSNPALNNMLKLVDLNSLSEEKEIIFLENK